MQHFYIGVFYLCTIIHKLTCLKVYHYGKKIIG